MRLAFCLMLLVGCEAHSTEDTGPSEAGPSRDAGSLFDGGRCPEVDLGSMEGEPVLASTLDDAVQRAGASCASGTLTAARFYVWTAPRTASFVISTAGADFDTVLTVLEGEQCDGPELGCHDNLDVDLTSRLALQARSGERYVIVVSGFEASSTGYYPLHIVEAPASEAGLCDNTADDDRDGLLDCADPDCALESVCVEVCDDALDNDGDGHVDCEDPDCEAEARCIENCTDGMDNDGNGLIDCADLDCALDSACPEDCTNGTDDDGDGAIDCADARCVLEPVCIESDCANELDDDGDGDTDCADLDCELDLHCTSS